MCCGALGSCKACSCRIRAQLSCQKSWPLCTQAGQPAALLLNRAIGGQGEGHGAECAQGVMHNASFTRRFVRQHVRPRYRSYLRMLRMAFAPGGRPVEILVPEPPPHWQQLTFLKCLYLTHKEMLLFKQNKLLSLFPFSHLAQYQGYEQCLFTSCSL